MVCSPACPGDTLVRILREKSRSWPERVAVRCQGLELSYSQLFDLAQRMATFLLSRGIQPGGRVFIVLPDCICFQVVFLGCQLAGIVAVPLNNRLRREDYSQSLRECGRGLLLAQAGSEALEAARESRTPAFELADHMLFDLLADVERAESDCGDANDVCALYITSGTTGHPKIVPHSHADFLAVAKTLGPFVELCGDDVVHASAKMCHCYGLMASMLFPYMVGASVVLDPERPGAENTLRLLREHRVTVFFSVPAVYTLLLLSSFDSADLESLRQCFSAGEAMPAAIYEQWLRRTGLSIAQGYGGTETTTFVISAKAPHVEPGKAGRVTPPYQARILDQNGKDAPDGAPGHLAVITTSTMKGYLNDPQWTAQAFTPDGWLLTGDMAVRENGVYTILGRMDDMFKAGGLWVSPARVEDALGTHPAVARCAVTAGTVGAFSLVRAHVTLNPGWEPGKDLTDALRRHGAETLPDFMVPADVVFHDELPTTVLGKVQRYKLR